MRERAQMGVSARAGRHEGGGNTARRRQKMRGYLLMGVRHRWRGRKNHGKPASPPTELGANKTSYASAKIGDDPRIARTVDKARRWTISKTWTIRRMQCSWLSRHLVSLSCSHFVTKDRSDPRYFIISGYLVSMNDMWYIATASHVLKQIDQLLAEHPREVLCFSHC